MKRIVPRKKVKPSLDNGVGFIVWRFPRNRDRITGPNGKRVVKVTYEDGTEQNL